MAELTDLADLVETLKREVAVPGQFAASFPGTTTNDLIGALSDGVANVQLIGFLKTSVLDLDSGVVTPALSPAARALVVIFTAERMLTMRLLELNQRLTVEAGSVKYETEKSASMLTEILRGLKERRREIVATATGVGIGGGGGFAMADQYADRFWSCGPLYAHERP